MNRITTNLSWSSDWWTQKLTRDLLLPRDVFFPWDNFRGPASSSGDHFGHARGGLSPLGLLRDIKAVLWFRRWWWRADITLFENHRWSFVLGRFSFWSLFTDGRGRRIVLRLGPERCDVNSLFTVKVKRVVKSQWSVELIALRRRCRLGPCGWPVPTLGAGSGFGIFPRFLHRGTLWFAASLCFPWGRFWFGAGLLLGLFPAWSLLIVFFGWDRFRSRMLKLLIVNRVCKVWICSLLRLIHISIITADRTCY